MPVASSRLVLTVCAAEILGMAPFSMFLALQPMLRDAWHLSNTGSGWISSAYYAGYMLAVPVLAGLTDRVDARRVWLGASGLTAAAALGFGSIAHGLWSALVFQALAGAGLAGTYMPGLKVMADRMTAIPHPRHVAFYTTSFTIGSSLSFWIVEQLAQSFSWRAAVALAALGPAAGWLLTASLPAVAPPPPEPSASSPWREVLRSTDTMRYVAGYACHMWELFALRAWLVPFLTFCQSLKGSAIAGPATIAAAISLFGVPSSLAGAELSARFDRRRLVIAIMIGGFILSLLLGRSVPLPWIVILLLAALYSAFISGDSAALTAGLVSVSPPGRRGAAMAVYSMTGFAAASAGSVAVGIALDWLGGQSVASWGTAFALIGASNIAGVYFLSRAKE